ncbi:MAG: RHS repeat-associated core domain-containing protein [Thaumarchaeota archaeon]|nr:RHS repeat-associated core domain-containing protein [Nitrososphaerota archaeon]
MKLIPESSHALAYIIQERDVNVVSKYFYANGLMIARVNPFATTYFHQDSLGSTRLTTSASKLQLFASNYKPFGPVYNQSGTEKVKYTGKWEDSATKLYYFGARYYDPEIGRFTTQDPVLGTSDDPQTLNRYPYAKNNPLKYVDPDGRFIDTIFDAFGILNSFHTDLRSYQEDCSSY